MPFEIIFMSIFFHLEESAYLGTKSKYKIHLDDMIKEYFYGQSNIVSSFQVESICFMRLLFWFSFNCLIKTKVNDVLVGYCKCNHWTAVFNKYHLLFEDKILCGFCVSLKFVLNIPYKKKPHSKLERTFLLRSNLHSTFNKTEKIYSIW